LILFNIVFIFFVIGKIETIFSGGIAVVMKGKLNSGKLTTVIVLIIIMPGLGYWIPISTRLEGLLV